MIEFFRDVLDGPLYIVTTILSIIFIMAIIGFLMERKKLEKEQQSKIAVVGTNQPEVVPITPVTVQQPTIQQTPVPQANVATVDSTQPVVAQPVEVASQVVTLENPNANPQ